MTRLTTPISGHANPKTFWSTFNLCKFVLTCKKSGYSIDLFWRYGRLKNPAIWLAENILDHISETKFSQIWDLCRKIANNIHFHYKTNSVKINDKFSLYIKKPLFLAYFPNSWGKFFFLVNPALSRRTSYGFLASCQNLEKTNDTVPRKRPDRQTLFHRTLPANAGGLIKQNIMKTNKN